MEIFPGAHLTQCVATFVLVWQPLKVQVVYVVTITIKMYRCQSLVNLSFAKGKQLYMIDIYIVTRAIIT